MLEALGNAIAALSANTAVTVVTATTDADVVATEKAKQALVGGAHRDITKERNTWPSK